MWAVILRASGGGCGEARQGQAEPPAPPSSLVLLLPLLPLLFLSLSGGEEEEEGEVRIFFENLRRVGALTLVLEYRRRLPHFQPDGVSIFLTWRLFGSLPAMRAKDAYRTPGHAFASVDQALDRNGSGPRWLRDPRIAGLVAESILSGVSRKHWYELEAWVVMPNHVHLLILPQAPVPTITRWLKAWTARRANQLLGLVGQPFWQDESYDHWARNRKERERIARYIEWNPVSAGLAATAEEWEWSSAWGGGRGQAEPPAPPEGTVV